MRRSEEGVAPPTSLQYYYGVYITRVGHKKLRGRFYTLEVFAGIEVLVGFS